MNRSFSIGMPGNKGHWPWPKETQKEGFVDPFGMRWMADPRVPEDEIHIKHGDGRIDKIVNLSVGRNHAKAS